MLLFCLLAVALTFVLVPSVEALSWRIGAVDVPKDWRRMHQKSIPRGGGIAIYFSFLTVSLCALPHSPILIAALVGGGLMLAVGLADDIWSLRPLLKLFLQMGVCIAAVVWGCQMRGIFAALAVFWVLMLINAHNFIDGLDGLFSGCAGIEGMALFLAFCLEGSPANGLPSFILALACLSFRYYNRHPARIFAGDCGSGCVGFLLGMLSLPLWDSMPVSVTHLSPLFLFAYPITDLVCSVTRRVLHGYNPFAADRAHLHHRICATGLSQVRCTGVLLSLSLGLSGIGVLLRSDALFPAAAFLCVCLVGLMVTFRSYILKFAT
jgi:UDP-GlcNAc:undecaprenyl-phosphate GlcNAc-1-phosphate transferase